MFARLFLICCCFLSTCIGVQINLNLKVSAEVKEDILATEDADEAYAKFLASYEDLEAPAMLMSIDLATHEANEAKRKNNFLNSLQKAKEHNKLFEAGESKYKMTVNSFSVMDEDERREFLGAVNATGAKANQAPLSSATGVGANLPSSKNWEAEGYVSSVLQQGDCGSCWTYPAVALIEFALKKSTGKLIQLSNQELLDCTYENSEPGYDACEGGWYDEAWRWVQKTQHIAPLASYAYKEYDNRCNYKRYPNAIKDNVEITGVVDVREGAQPILKAIQIMPLAVAMFVEDDFYFIDSGLYDGCVTNHPQPNHAVLMTGYGPNYWEIKNTWGSDWSRNGYCRFDRSSIGVDYCGLLNYAKYITFNNLQDNGETPPPQPEPTTENTQVVTTEATMAITTQEVEVTTTAVATAETYLFCEAGMYSNGEECVQCQKNSYSSWGATSCTSCPDGTIAPAGATSAQDCEVPHTECQDEYETCQDWAAKRFCERGQYVSFMENNCPQSCGLCQVTCEAGYYRDERMMCEMCPENTYSNYGDEECQACPRGTSSAAGSTDRSDCQSTDFCEDSAGTEWCESVKPLSYCTSRQKQMKRKCAYSCGFCSRESASDCQDTYATEDCLTWKERDFCYSGQYVQLMEKNCAKTCGTCGGADTEEENAQVQCRDNNEYASDCGDWVDSGFCEQGNQYQAFMLQNCALSCGACTETSTMATTAPTTTEHAPYTSTEQASYTAATQGCQDNEQYADNCVSWATTGYCTTGDYIGFMEVNCVESCGRCTEEEEEGWYEQEEEECTDKEPHQRDCVSWAQQGLCYNAIYAAWMSLNCPSSCGNCEYSNLAAVVCGDNNENCEVWADQGHCASGLYADYMRDNCQLSCRLCAGQQQEERRMRKKPKKVSKKGRKHHRERGGHH